MEINIPWTYEKHYLKGQNHFSTAFNTILRHKHTDRTDRETDTQQGFNGIGHGRYT